MNPTSSCNFNEMSSGPPGEHGGKNSAAEALVSGDLLAALIERRMPS
jgi:hypothetical protein